MSRVDRPDKAVRREVNRTARAGMRSATSGTEWLRWSDSYIGSQRGNWDTERKLQQLYGNDHHVSFLDSCDCDSCH